MKLDDGSRTEFDNAQTISFSGENPKCFVVQKPRPAGRPSGDSGWSGTDLLVHDLSSGHHINIGNVKSFSFNKAGNLLALVIDAEGKSGNGVQLFHVNESRITTLVQGKATYGSLSWTREGDALCLLKTVKDKKYENAINHVIAFTNVGGSGQKEYVIDPVKVAAIPEDMTISPNRSPSWDDDRSMVLFGIHELKAKEAPKKPDPTAKPTPPSNPGEVADLVVWHWQDKQMQSMQQKREAITKRRFHLCVHHVADQKTFRLGDDEIPTVSVSRPYKFAIGSDNRKYERMGNLDGRRYRDIYSINMKTGKRKLLLEKARYALGVGPSGIHYLYYDDGNRKSVV